MKAIFKYRLQIFDDELGKYRNVRPNCNRHGDPFDDDGVYYHTSDQAQEKVDLINANPEAPKFRAIKEIVT